MVSTTIFQDGKLKPGIYKIQNLYTENYLDIHLHSMELCCRPAKDLGNGRGLVRALCPPHRFTHLTTGEVENKEIWGWICDLEGVFVDSIDSRSLPLSIERHGA